MALSKEQAIANHLNNVRASDVQSAATEAPAYNAMPMAPQALTAIIVQWLLMAVAVSGDERNIVDEAAVVMNTGDCC